jgi:hypothetical protein
MPIMAILPMGKDAIVGGPGLLHYVMEGLPEKSKFVGTTYKKAGSLHSVGA